ncbi:MAG: RDD family protein [Planctomycetes bacterium]|nr:RDD family protein [Planctomycetota bacterium]
MDRRADFVAIETPDHVILHYEVAGLMSRILAGGVDALFQAAIAVTMVVAAIIAGTSELLGWASGASSEISKLSIAFFVILLFVDVWGYSILFEIFMRGQTPGKRLLRIRVIRDGGYALAPGEVIVRNLMRIVDFLPWGYLAGLTVMFLNRQNKRIGDYVAGTLVIRDVPLAAPVAPPASAHSSPPGRPQEWDELRGAGVARLSPERIGLIDDFLERRSALDAETRRRLARLIAEPVAAQLQRTVTDHEQFIEDVARAVRELRGQTHET